MEPVLVKTTSENHRGRHAAYHTWLSWLLEYKETLGAIKVSIVSLTLYYTLGTYRKLVVIT